MSKRFIDTDMWKKRWFRSLKPEQKALWIYLFTNCDNSGVWEADKELAQFFIGGDINWDEAEKIFSNHIQILNNGSKWWLLDFINFQYGNLSEACKPHLHVINLLKKHRLFKGYSKGINNLEDKDKDKDTDKDQDMDLEKDKGKETVKDVAPTTPIQNHAEILYVVDQFYQHRIATNPIAFKTFDKEKSYSQSILELDKLIRIDKYTLDEIKSVLNFAVNDSFWQDQVYSLARLRRKSGNGETKFKNIYLKFKASTKQQDAMDAWAAEMEEK